MMKIVRSSRLSQNGSNNNSSDHSLNTTSSLKFQRSSSQPDAHPDIIERRWRSSSICAETLHHDRLIASKKHLSITPDLPNMEVTTVMVKYQNPNDQCLGMNNLSTTLDDNAKTDSNNTNKNSLLKATMSNEENLLQLPIVRNSKAFNDTEQLKTLQKSKSDAYLSAMNSTDNKLSSTNIATASVPRWECCVTPSPTVSSNSSRSSCTSASCSYETRAISWSMLRTAIIAHGFTVFAASRTVNANNTINNNNINGSETNREETVSQGKLKKIATQLTQALRRKRRETLALKRETRATVVVAGILGMFLVLFKLLNLLQFLFPH
ncbi:unnamed protein product [Thelazia callipaeda]|uniref:Miff domain-containing protein n=1 Tax=Thelazia callipaeda TaxID=103827 RepID=A0A0N5DCE9_THECL|nr:unnamed protein product [Thelazia callipaeda]